MTTSSRNYNPIALRGGEVDDMEAIELYNLDPKLAYTPQLGPAMIIAGIQQDLDSGIIDDKEANMRRKRHMANYQELLFNK